MRCLGDRLAVDGGARAGTRTTTVNADAKGGEGAGAAGVEREGGLEA